MDAQRSARFRTEGCATAPPGVTRRGPDPAGGNSGEGVRGRELVAEDGAGPAPHTPEGPAEACAHIPDERVVHRGRRAEGGDGARPLLRSGVAPGAYR